MPATLRDVATHAQVSLRTVSNVIRGYTHVSDAMRKKVMDAITELDYRPNLVARTLRTGRTGVLALVVPEIDLPYFSTLARHVIDAAAELGYRVMIDQTGPDHDTERELFTSTDRRMLFDGILFAPLVTKTELDAMTITSSIPFVLLGEYEFDGTFDHVAIDNFQAAYDATSHLIGLGRTRIAAIGSQPDQAYATPQLRTAGYQQALLDAGITPDPALIRPAGHYRRSDGYEAARALLEAPEHPDAVFCYSDLLAIGALRGLDDAGLSVPDDIAVIGIDDIDEGVYSRPSLSTVSLDIPFIAHQAVAHLVRRIDDPDTPAEEVVAPHRLMPRESTLGATADQKTEAA
ncbi:MAG: LacI family transcriptional regulator [Propionibacteriaceae bacterium]|nr:LacI family transcriptional regulator [Propionibacteriaceae bacterium]